MADTNGILCDRAAWIALLAGLLAASLALLVPEPIQHPPAILNASAQAALVLGPLCLTITDTDGVIVQRCEIDLTANGPKLFTMD